MCLSVFAVLLAAAAGLGQSSADWQAGVAKVNITPNEPIRMAGFASRTHPSEGVRLNLYAKALALRDEAGAVSVLVTLDVCDISSELTQRVAEQCRTRFGVPRERLVLNVSHTHSGPIVALGEISGWYSLTPSEEQVVHRYTNTLIDQIVEAVGLSIRDLAPAALSFQQGFAGIAVNRRRVWQRQLPGPVDQDVPVLAVRRPDGALRAVVMGYSCHATVLNDYRISGDWPGFAQQEIETAHPGASAMFVQGAGADANALPRQTVELAQGYGRILAAAVEDVLQRRMRPMAGPLKAAFETVEVPFRSAPSREELEKRVKDKDPMRRRQVQHLLDVLNRDGKLPARYPYPVQVWQFGAGPRMIILGGEVVADYSLRLKKQFGWEDTWVAGYSNDVFAYIPSLRVLKEGGYEGGDAMLGDGFPAPFGAAVEEVIVEKISEMVQRLGASAQNPSGLIQ